MDASNPSTPYRFHSAGSPHGQIVIYLHSLTQGDNTPFAKHIIDALTNMGVMVYSLTFDFLQKGVDPSPDLSKEKVELERLIKQILEENSMSRLSLVGKSLGGVIGLKIASENHDLSIDAVHILGLPLVLGYPPRVDLLRNSPPQEFNCLQEYAHVFSNVNVPAQIIQGTADNLGPIHMCRELVEKFQGLVSLDVVPGADHSFMTGGDRKWDECAVLLTKNL